ncbi:LPXTG-motif cell wall anchor domain-containing protein [Streptococcus pneumoniae]|nr:LPXTG-motif cell wall anchor domain-containing protein [Streptococcus pneumoniae]
MFYKGNEDREKRLRFSIRKVSFGAASVAVAALFMFPGNGTVSATEQGVTPTNEGRQGSPLKDPDVQNGTYGATPVVSQLDGNSGSSETTAPKDQEETTTPTSTDASAPSVESPTVSKEKEETSTTATSAPVVSSTASATEEAEEKATPALDKKQLEDYVAEIDAKLASGSYATKTDESVATLKEHLELAKLALTTAKSQEELTKVYRKLLMTASSGLRNKPKAQVESPKLDTTEGKATVGKKASKTEKATESNSIANSGQHDPRNRQALDRNNPFRTDGTTTDSDPSAHQTYTAPSADASLDTLVNALKNLPDVINNETKLADIDQVAATKGIDPGTVKELEEFGGWKAVRDSAGNGKFAVARKTTDGVFPIETVNTVKVTEYTNRTWTQESVVDRRNEHILLLSEVRTQATRNQEVFDKTEYKENGEALTIARGLTGYNGIEKTFKAFSPTVGSTTKVSFKTGYTGDIDGRKAKYKVEVLGRTDETSTPVSLYSVTFDPSSTSTTTEMKVIAARDGSSQRFDTGRGNTPKESLNKKLAESKYSPNGTTGTFTSKDIEIPVGYTEYTVRISSADNTHLGMGYQALWKHYALPITGLEFSITQDTKHIAKSLLQQAYDRLLEQQNSDENRKTPGTTRNYQEKLDEIKELLDSGDLKSRTDYLTALEAAIEARDDLKTQAPSAPSPTVKDESDHVGIEIPAPEHADKVVVTFDKADGSGKDTVTVKKNDQGKWSADKTVAGLTVDADTGKVTVGHEAVKAEGTVEAQARSGNSDLSSKGSAQMPIYRPAPLPRPIPVPDNGNTNSLVPSDLDGNQPGNAGDVNTTEPASPSVPTSPSDSGQANSGQDGRSTDSGSTTTARSSVAPVTTTEPSANTANREDDTVRSATQGQGTLDKSELSKQTQTLENLLRSLTGVSNPTTDSARLVLAEAKKALADDSLTEQGLRHILQTVKDAIASLESIKESQSATKAGEQKVSESAPEADKPVAQTQVPVGIIAASILVLLGLLFFLLARRNKESELEKLAKELSKLLKDSNLETVDKDVLENSQEELQKAVSFLADEKGSEHTEAELIDNLKEVIAKLKANA